MRLFWGVWEQRNVKHRWMIAQILKKRDERRELIAPSFNDEDCAKKYEITNDNTPKEIRNHISHLCTMRPKTNRNLCRFIFLFTLLVYSIFKPLPLNSVNIYILITAESFKLEIKFEHFTVK